jgi:hypothetical protein
MKIGYTAINKQTKERIEFFAYTEETAQLKNGLTAYHWIVNHLDVSYHWDFYPNGKFKHE